MTHYYPDVASLGQNATWLVRRTDRWSTEDFRAFVVQRMRLFADQRSWVTGWTVEEIFIDNTLMRKQQAPRSPGKKVLIFTIHRRGGDDLECGISFGKGEEIDQDGILFRFASMFTSLDRQNRA